MLTLTLKGMRARKLRLVLSAVSVILGVAFVTASFTLGDTIRSSFDDHIATANEGVDAVVLPAGALDSSMAGADGIPNSLVDRIAAVDGIAAAEGTTSGFAQLRAPDTGASALSSSGLSIGWIEDDVLNPLTIVKGAAPTGPDQVVVDPKTAEDIGVGIGETARLITRGPARDVTVVGFAELGKGGISVLGIEAKTAAESFGYTGQVNEIRVRGNKGLTERQVADAVTAALASTDAASSTLVRTGTEVTADNVDDVAEQTGVITTFLLVFAGITLFVGGFLIVNTFAMLTAQRTRELAVLRALGASRGQLLRGVVTESAIIGLVAAVAGLGVGLGLASGMEALLGALGLGLPETSLALTPRTVIVALVLGPAVTAVASLMPARRAAAVQPVAAMRESALPTVRRRRRVVLGAALTLAAVSASLAGQLAESTPLVGLSAIGLILSAIVWGPLLIGPATRVLAWPLVRLGGRPTRLAEGNVVRAPHRSASTAAALLVGVALVSGTAVIGSSMSGMAEKEITGTIRADVVLWAAGGMPFGTATGEQVRSLPGVETVAPVRLTEGSVTVGSAKTTDEVLSAIDPAGAAKVLDLRMVEGSMSDLADGQVLVTDDEKVAVGDDVTVSVPGSAPLKLTVGGVFEASPAVGTYLLSTADLASVAPRASDMAVYVTAADGVSDTELAATLDTYLVDAFPLVGADTMDEFVEANRGFVDQAVAMVSGLLGLSLLVALLGVANTLTLSVIERTREIGMLRSIGMSRRQLRSMVRVEALLMAAYGGLLGVLIGLELGHAVASVLMEGIEVPVVLPGWRLALYATVAVLAAVAAATLPARRAAKLNVLDAVSTA
jgi:putative ABC transport system permease protein